MKTKAALLVSLFLFFFNTNCSQNTEPKMDDDFQFLLTQIDPQFSYDGQKIVFKGLYDSVYAVHFVDISGNYLGYILRHKGFLSSPTWSPDNNKIAVSIEGNLYSVKINGDSLTKLTNTGEDFFCNWSPDGRYIAYTKSICDPECGIMLYDFSDGSVSLITQFGSYSSWDNNSKKIHYRTNLYVKNPNTGIADYKGFVFRRKNIDTNITDSLYNVNNNNLTLTDCTVSPDEQEILFAASYGAPPIINIWKINLQNGEMIQMTFEGGNCPAYNPTGDKIVYTNTNITEGGLWIMNRDGSNKQRFTKLCR